MREEWWVIILDLASSSLQCTWGVEGLLKVGWCPLTSTGPLNSQEPEKGRLSSWGCTVPSSKTADPGSEGHPPTAHLPGLTSLPSRGCSHVCSEEGNCKLIFISILGENLNILYWNDPCHPRESIMGCNWSRSWPIRAGQPTRALCLSVSVASSSRCIEFFGTLYVSFSLSFSIFCLGVCLVHSFFHSVCLLPSLTVCLCLSCPLPHGW